jgi:hypothetical protein
MLSTQLWRQDNFGLFFPVADLKIRASVPFSRAPPFLGLQGWSELPWRSSRLQLGPKNL